MCRALAIGREQNGLDLRDHLRLAVPAPDERQISAGPRVGLRLAPDRPWCSGWRTKPMVSRDAAVKRLLERAAGHWEAAPGADGG